MIRMIFRSYFCPWGGGRGESQATQPQKGGQSHQPEEKPQHTNTATPQGRGRGGRGGLYGHIPAL